MKNKRKKDAPFTAREKIMQCSIVADVICSSNIRSMTDFPKVLGLSMETFLLCCNDENSDIRLMADECLNRTIKSLIDSHLGRLLVELFKEIKKNGPARSLRAALSRFGDICHFMRPQKCRPYTVNLIPALVKIGQRNTEESVQETLAVAFSKIMPVLGQHTSDKDVRTLLKVFIPNLSSNSAIVRRAAATSLTCICQHSRRPAQFFSWLLMGLFDLILPAQGDHSVYLILGVLVCFRNILPHINESLLTKSFRDNDGPIENEEETGVTKQHMLKVYEIVLHFCYHPDHNVVTATLETLYQFLKCAPFQFQQILISNAGIQSSLIFEVQKLNRLMSESQTSIVPSSASLDESTLVDDLDIYVPDKKVDNHLPFVEDQGDTCQTDASQSLDGESEISIDEPTTQYKPDSENYFFGSPEGNRKAFLKKGASDEDTLEGDEDFWAFNTPTPSPGPLTKTNLKVGNIGTFTSPDIPLNYCTRILGSSFLLNGTKGGCISDRNIKVSVKSLALGCLSNVFYLYPSAFFLPLYIDEAEEENVKDMQRIHDVVLFASHPDPHIRGQVAVMIGHLLGTALRLSGGDWFKYRRSYCEGAPSIVSLLSRFEFVVKDDSSLASRLGLIGLKQCLNQLLNSYSGLKSLKILTVLISVTRNAYWLTKVELAELVACIPFKVVYYLELKNVTTKNTTCFQEKALKDILIPLLGDEDARVRMAAATAFVKLVPQLYFPFDQPNSSSITAIAKDMADAYLDISLKDSSSSFPLVHALVKPFATENSVQYNPAVDTSLSKIINMLVCTLRMSSNKYLVYGCCSALHLLADKYYVTVFPETWAATFSDFKSEAVFSNTSNSEILDYNLKENAVYSDLLCHLLSFVCSTSLCLDLSAHQHVLHLVGNLLCGVSYRICVENLNDNTDKPPEELHLDPYFSFVLKKIFLHLMRVLNIFTHVLEEQYPVSNRTALPSLPNAPSLSPIKRKKAKEENPLSSPSLKGSPIKITDKPDVEKERSNASSNKITGNMGAFHSCPLYMKLFEILHRTYGSYKISMDFQSNEKFCQLLRCALEVMGQVLEVSESAEMGKVAEEMLCYLRSIMCMESSLAVQCVRQLLKCLFGTNLIALCQEAEFIGGMDKKCDSPSKSLSNVPGLYDIVISDPYSVLNHILAEKSIRNGERVSNVVSFKSLHWVKRASDKVTILLKSASKIDKHCLANHIRLFESVVIRALQQYTVSSDVNFQCSVLDLLVQLVLLRVNYCLLDSDQVFITFVLKQFEFIEEGQIPNAESLIDRIFHFIILLSYERFHSKMVITVPQILQHCDRLIASGQSPEKYVVPALKPVIEDLFLLRGLNKMDVSKELDAQREVIVSQVFKLVNYGQVLELFSMLILHSRQEGEDKWKKTSRQVVDVILPLLSRQQMLIENQNHLNMLHKLLEQVAPNVFRPVDILLKALFTHPNDLTVPINMNRWMCLILSILRILISQAKEESVISRLEDMRISVKIFKLQMPSHLRCDKDHFPSYSGEYEEYLPSSIFARFLFQVLGVVVESLHNHVYMQSLSYEHNTFLCQQASHLLLYLTYMFQSGTFRSVTTSVMAILKEKETLADKLEMYYSVNELEVFFHKIELFYPTLAVQWFNLLTLLNYDSDQFWSLALHPSQGPDILQSEPSATLIKLDKEKFLPCNLEMIHRGGIILLCDYMCDNPNDVVKMTWLIVNHVYDMIELSLETTVQDFLSTIHQKSAASGLWIQAIISAYPKKNIKPKFLKKALNCLENIHSSQSGKLLSLLVENFMYTPHLLISDKCDKLACQRMELLLSEHCCDQLSTEDVDKMIKFIDSKGISKRHEKFLSLCNEMKAQLQDVPLKETEETLPTTEIKDIKINKEWYITFVKKQCEDVLISTKECARLLSRFKYEDIFNIMASKQFDPAILEECLKHGANLMISSEKYLPARSNNPFIGVVETPGSALYRAAHSVLLQNLIGLASILPTVLRCPKNWKILFKEKSFWDLAVYQIPCLSSYLSTLEFLPDRSVSRDYHEHIVLFTILSCECVFWRLKTSAPLSSEMLKSTLQLLDNVLKKPYLSTHLTTPTHILKTAFLTNSIHHIISYNAVLPKFNGHISTEEGPLTKHEACARKACIQIMEMIEWVEQQSSGIKFDIPDHLNSVLISIIKGLARLPLVNSFARTPPVLWQLGWKPEISGFVKTIVPPPPGKQLLEREVLKQYIFRINILGWISRQQFEETWMALLGVLSATPVDGIDGKDDDEEGIRTSCLAVKSITSLLLQTLLLPEPGNPHNSRFLVQPRDKPLAFPHTKCGKKLMRVRLPIHLAFQKLLHCERPGEQIFDFNIERITTPYQYSLSQVSLEYLSAAAGLVEDSEDLDGSASSNSSPVSTNIGSASFQQREQFLSNVGLDIHSCLHFLIDLYNQWLSRPTTPLMLLTEVTKSVVALSDIFMEKAQFEWMLDTFLEVQRIHLAEDEIIAQYLIFGICKSAAVLGFEQEWAERLKKLLELNLKSAYLPTRMASLHGLLYLLEQSGETFPFLCLAGEYVLKHLESTNVQEESFCDNEDHVLMLWALTFYIMENYNEEAFADEDFSQSIFQVCRTVCSSTDDSNVYLAILHGLERLLIGEMLTGKEANYLLKLIVDRIRTGSPTSSLAALGFFLSCMYIGKSTNMWCNELVPDTAEKGQNSSREMDSEFLLVAMERVTTLFDRIKKDYPFEAEIVCEILPSFLIEFFPMQEVLNKIITEFLSSQQPHLKLMARVIFEVFHWLHKQKQTDTMQEWVLLSLSNFTQRSPLSIAVWSLSCFFVSASTNPWLRAIFPHILSRMGKMEKEDRTLFCIVGVDFRNQLPNNEQKQAFSNTIKGVAYPHTPYSDLLQCL